MVVLEEEDVWEYCNDRIKVRRENDLVFIQMIRFMSRLSKLPVTLTKKAEIRLSDLCRAKDSHGFVFSAESGGCSGLNYKLKSIKNESDISELKLGNLSISHVQLPDGMLYIDPMFELFLVGTVIDYVPEDIENNVFDSKFVFKNEGVMTCGCGSSFVPKEP